MLSSFPWAEVVSATTLAVGVQTTDAFRANRTVPRDGGIELSMLIIVNDEGFGVAVAGRGARPQTVCRRHRGAERLREAVSLNQAMRRLFFLATPTKRDCSIYRACEDNVHRTFFMYVYTGVGRTKALQCTRRRINSRVLNHCRAASLLGRLVNLRASPCISLACSRRFQFFVFVRPQFGHVIIRPSYAYEYNSV